jgi:hypothetical protein
VVGGAGDPVGQFAVGADRATDVQQHAAAGDVRGRGLDAGDLVAVAGDDVAGPATVPGVAVVEDVAEAVPLGGGLQRHEDDVVGAADAVWEALGAALGVGAGVQHRVHRVGAPAPALLRAVHVEGLREREAHAAVHETRAFDPLVLGEEVQRAQHVVGPPTTPVRAALRGRGDGALRVRAVELSRKWHVWFLLEATHTTLGQSGRVGKTRCLMTGISGVDTVLP